MTNAHTIHNHFFLITGMYEVSHCDGDDDLDLEGVEPTPNHQRLAREGALEQSLASRLYPQFSDCEERLQLYT